MQGFLLNSRMQNCLQPLSRRGVRKNSVTHGAAIQGSVGGENGGAKRGSNFIQRWLARLNQFASDNVRIDDNNAQGLKKS